MAAERLVQRNSRLYLTDRHQPPPEHEPKSREITAVEGTAVDDIAPDDMLSVFGFCRAASPESVPEDVMRLCVLFAHYPVEDELYMGNLHKESRLKKRSEKRNTHTWAMFMSTSRHKLVPPRTIESVEYTLHSTFRRPKRDVSESPFRLACKGDGCFEVNAVIKFKPRYKKADIHCAHYLSFDVFAKLTQVSLPETEGKAEATFTFASRKKYPINRPAFSF